MNAALGLLVLALAALGQTACTKKASPAECDQLLDRFAELVVKERFADAGAADVDRERIRERAEAKADPSFKNCTSEVQKTEYACAIKATTPEAMIKCLE
jgi:hypothetical protein